MLLTVSLKIPGDKSAMQEKVMQLNDIVAIEIYQGVKKYIDRKLVEQYKVEKIRHE